MGHINDSDLQYLNKTVDLNAFIRIYAYFNSVIARVAKLNTEKPLLLMVLSPYPL
uniref:Uncharacterized protein n=1 Tax=Polynucleobacter necessarius subsp. necessarius (strain STIR1) TaxID=452638 RepID=B1XV36_POLNS